MISVNCNHCGKSYATYPSRIGKTKYCSRSCKASSNTERFFVRGNTINVGRVLSPQSRAKISKAHKGKRSLNKSTSKEGV